MNAKNAVTNSILSGDSGFTLNGAEVTNQLCKITLSDRARYPAPFHTDGRTLGSYANLVRSDGSIVQIASKDFSQALVAASPTNLLLVP